MDSIDDAASGAIETVFGAIVADAADHIADDRLNIDPCLRANLACNNRQAGGDHRLACAANLRHIRRLTVGRNIALPLKLDLLLEDSIEDSIGDLIAYFVRMPLGNRLRREKIGIVRFSGHEAPPSSLSAVPP